MIALDPRAQSTMDRQAKEIRRLEEQVAQLKASTRTARAERSRMKQALIEIVEMDREPSSPSCSRFVDGACAKVARRGLGETE